MKKIQPIDSFFANERLTGDKSVSHRAVVLCSCVNGKSEIKGSSMGEDVKTTIDCMRELGAKIEIKGDVVTVHGTDKFQSGKQLDCKNSATTMRLLCGLLSARGVSATLIGDASLQKRPMRRVETPLKELGANLWTTKGKAPVFISPKKLQSKEIEISVPSAQVKSAVLLAGLFTDGGVKITEKIRTRDHTERLLKRMGATVEESFDNGHSVFVSLGNLHATDVDVPVDISSASFLLALGAVKGKVCCKDVGINPTRTGLLTAFERLGVRYELSNRRTVSEEERADITVFQSAMHGMKISASEIPTMIDELPVIAVLAAFANGTTVIVGAGELRFKESDRLTGIFEMLSSLGGKCIIEDDTLTIEGTGSLQGGTVLSHGDHRMAMAGTVALLLSKEGGTLYDDDCVGISFPDFFERLQKNGAKIQ